MVKWSTNKYNPNQKKSNFHKKVRKKAYIKTRSIARLSTNKRILYLPESTRTWQAYFFPWKASNFCTLFKTWGGLQENLRLRDSFIHSQKRSKGKSYFFIPSSDFNLRSTGEVFLKIITWLAWGKNEKKSRISSAEYFLCISWLSTSLDTDIGPNRREWKCRAEVWGLLNERRSLIYSAVDAMYSLWAITLTGYFSDGLCCLYFFPKSKSFLIHLRKHINTILQSSKAKISWWTIS